MVSTHQHKMLLHSPRQQQKQQTLHGKSQNCNHDDVERELGDDTMEEKKVDPPTDDADRAKILSSSLPLPSSHLPQSPSLTTSATQGQWQNSSTSRARHHHHHHVHFSSQHPPSASSPYYNTPLQYKSCTESSSLSSSWTDHRRLLRDRTASFSHSQGDHQHYQQPQHHHQQQRGRNIRNRSDSRIISSWQQQPLYFTPSAVPSIMASSATTIHHQPPSPPIVPSFTQLEFPPLTPASTLTKAAITTTNLEKEGDRKGMSLSIPKQSTITCPPASWSDAVKMTVDTDWKATAKNDDTHNDDASASSSSAWMQGIPPLPLLDNLVPTDFDIDEGRMAVADERYQTMERHSIHSVNDHGTQHLQSSTTHFFHTRHTIDTISDVNTATKAVAAPCSSYTTMSTSALLNDIGTLFARSNRVDEAMRRYRLCIKTAMAALDDIQTKNVEDVDDEDVAQIGTATARTLPQVCKKKMEAEGLAWFRHKLLRGGGGDATITAANTLGPISPLPDSSNNWNDIVHDIHQHQKLDCPTEYVYSCNGLTPLGLEYVCDPLPVLGSSLRNFISGKGIDTASAATMEWMALIAARVNLANLEYRLAGGGSSEKLHQVLITLELASDDCRDFANFMIDNRLEEAFSIFQLLQAVVHSNIGTVKYRLNKVRESMTSFEMAKSALEKCELDPALGDDENWPDFKNQSAEEYHNDNRFPPHHYLLLAVHLNLARVSLRLNKPDEAAQFCERIFTVNTSTKPLQRRVIRSPGGTDRYHSGASMFCRSNSSTATSFNIETTMIAYEHDVDRRSQWLRSVAEHYISGLIYETKGEISDYKEAWHHYNRLLSLARVKLDHRHVYICTLLERRGAVLFEQRKLQCSMLSYLACLKILEHQQTTGSNVFNEADLSRVLYGVARVLHDREEYHDALHMYHRALKLQRTLAAASGRPSLDVIKTLCNISRVHHLSGEIDAALGANREVLDLALSLLDGKMEHPFLIHRLKIEGNILVEVGRLEDAMKTFVEAARRCSEDGRDRMMSELMGGSGSQSSQEDADAGDSSVLSIRSATALAQINVFHPAAASA